MPWSFQPNTVVIGKHATLSRPGAIAQDEIVLDWPDQGTAERNWARNRELLNRVIAAGGPIRDIDVASGVLRGNTGFLARERMHMRCAGLRLDRDGYWRMPERFALIHLAPVLIARARAAAAVGAPTFAVPEATPVVMWIASHVATPDVCAEATAWRERGARYHDLVRLAARAALALDRGDFTPLYRTKTAAELEPMLALWPHVLALPTTASLSAADLIRLRAFPVHPLGLVAEPRWADGSFVSPSEYFFHDLDHARFKVREDCLVRGLDVPDAYQNGSTLDARSGRHRTILPVVADRLAAPRRIRLLSAEDAQVRSIRVRRLLAGMRAAIGVATMRAAELLLFEILHEKSLPPEQSSLARAFADDAHIAKLFRKHAIRYFGADDPGRAVLNALPAARALLARASTVSA